MFEFKFFSVGNLYLRICGKNA